MAVVDPQAGYRCSTVARWLPRVLAAAVLTAALVTSFTVDPQGLVARSATLKGLLAALGGLLAIWILRKGAEVRLVITLGPEAIEFGHGAKSSSLPYRDIEAVDYSPSFGPSRSWLPAAVLLDRDGQRWRIPALIAGGDRLILELLERCGRSDLDAWADVRRLESRMGRASRILALGYGAAGSILGLATAFYVG